RVSGSDTPPARLPRVERRSVSGGRARLGRHVLDPRSPIHCVMPRSKPLGQKSGGYVGHDVRESTPARQVDRVARSQREPPRLGLDTCLMLSGAAIGLLPPLGASWCAQWDVAPALACRGPSPVTCSRMQASVPSG